MTPATSKELFVEATDFGTASIRNKYLLALLAHSISSPNRIASSPKPHGIHSPKPYHLPSPKPYRLRT
jgi:hypothetical protein